MSGLPKLNMTAVDDAAAAKKAKKKEKKDKKTMKERVDRGRTLVRQVRQLARERLHIDGAVALTINTISKTINKGSMRASNEANLRAEGR